MASQNDARGKSLRIGSVSRLGAIASPGETAVITGASSGIGLATARFCARQHMNVILADIDLVELEVAVTEIRAIAESGKPPSKVEGIPCNVADPTSVEALRDVVFGKYGSVSFLMLNAGIGSGGGALAPRADWERTLAVNMWGVIHGAQAFVPAMKEREDLGMIIITGSKQGITMPPGNLAYNVSKAAVKTYAEGLQHELRNTDDNKLSVHLLVPGWTNTSIMLKSKRAEAKAKGETFDPETVFFSESKPAKGAWTPAQVVDYMVEKLTVGTFYIICPDNETDEATDRARMEWTMQDITTDRVPLSRWHVAYKAEFNEFLRSRRDSNMV